MVHPKLGLRPHINCQSFYYCLERWRDTTYSNTVALPLHALTVSLTQSQRLFTIKNNTIHSRVTILSFIGEIPWENNTVNPIPWVRKAVGQHSFPVTPRQGEWVYNTPGLQTQLNNISGSGRSGSTTNKFWPKEECHLAYKSIKKSMS